MSWFTPPRLLKKPAVHEWLRLPPEIHIRRLRWLLLMGMGFFGLLAATASYIIGVLLESYGLVSRAYHGVIVGIGATVGIVLGCVLMMKMVYLAMASAKMNDSNSRLL